MKIGPICLLTACKRRKFKLFRDSSQVRAMDNGITCCYWSASLSNRLLALKAHSSLFKCCARTAQTICTGYKENIVVLESGYFFDYLCHCNWFLLSFFNFYSISLFFLIRGGGCHWQEQPQGRKVTLAGPKSDIGRAEKSHKGQNVTLECYNVCYYVVITWQVCIRFMWCIYPCKPGLLHWYWDSRDWPIPTLEAKRKKKKKTRRGRKKGTNHKHISCDVLYINTLKHK